MLRYAGFSGSFYRRRVINMKLHKDTSLPLYDFSILWNSILLAAAAFFFMTMTAWSDQEKSAGEVLPASPSLEDYQRYAEAHSPALESARLQWQAAGESAKASGVLPDPKISYSWYAREVETRAGAQQQRIGLSQTLPGFGKLSLEKQSAIENARVQQALFENMRLRLRRRVALFYWELVYLDRAIETTGENVQLLEFFESVARSRYRAGEGLQSALLRAQVERDRIIDRQADLQDMRRAELARFNALLNRPPQGKIVTAEATETVQSLPAQKVLIETALQGNPALIAQAYRITEKEKQFQLASRMDYPDFTLGVDYIETNDALRPGISDSGKDPVILSIALNIPLWRGKYRALERAAELRQLTEEERLRDLENQVIASLEAALARLRESRRKIALYQDELIPRAQQTLSITQRAFSSGEVPFTDLIEAEQVLLDFQLVFHRAVADQGKALAEIEMLTGRWAGEEGE
jgi:outer membrane protein TolC